MSNRDKNRKVTVYCLEFNGEYVYVGSTNNLGRRLRSHVKDLEHRCHQNQFMQRVFNKYGLNDTKILQDNIERANADEIEAYWIDKMIQEGHKVCNMTRPSKHFIALTNSETYNTYCHHLSERIKQSYQRSDVIERKRLANLRPETHAKRVAGAKRCSSRPEWRRRNSESQKIAQARPEVKRKISEASKRMHSRPEIKLRNGKMRGFINRYGTGRIFKYLNQIAIDNFVFEDWHHFIIAKNLVIVFLWDTREIVKVFENIQLPGGYVQIGHFDSFELLSIPNLRSVLSNNHG